MYRGPKGGSFARALVAVALALLPEPVQAVTPGQAVKAAVKDVLGIPKGDRHHMRYLWVPGSEKELPGFLVAVGRLHPNLLNRKETVFKYPHPVLPDVWRVDLRDFHWPPALWEKFLAKDVHFHVKVPALEDVIVETYWPGGVFTDGKFYEAGTERTPVKKGQLYRVQPPGVEPEDWDQLRRECYTEVPVLNAEWWFVQTCRQISLRNEEEGTGYYDFLGLKSRDDYFKLIGLDQTQAIVKLKEMRAVVEKSGVSEQTRAVGVLRAGTGNNWFTLDTKKQAGRGVLKKNLLPGEFLHDAEEYYGFLPNGLWVTYLSDAKGVQQATAPDFIGPDDSPLRVGRDGRVHSNLSCMRCHGISKDMLRPLDDWVRNTYKTRWNPHGTKTYQTKDKEKFLQFQRLYETDLPRAMDRDREDYIHVLSQVTATDDNPKGLTAEEATKAYGEAYNRYVEEGVDAAKAAREIGVTKEEYLAGLKRHAEVLYEQDSILAEHHDKPNHRIPRLDFEDAIQEAQFIGRGLVPPIYAVRAKR